MLLSIDGVQVLTDPFLRTRLGPLQRHGSRPATEPLRPDVVLISHGHRDHFDRASLARVGGEPVFVVPKGLGTAIRNDGSIRGDVIELVAGQVAEIGGVEIRATPARHWISPGAPRAQPIGYVIERGVRVYFAGDTGAFGGMRDFARDVDLALVPVWTWGPHLGPGHLGPRAAASVIRDLAPGAAVPIHWGTLYPRGLHRVWRRPLDEPAERFADHVHDIAPAVDVRVLRPGDSTSFGVAGPTTAGRR